MLLERRTCPGLSHVQTRGQHGEDGVEMQLTIGTALESTFHSVLQVLFRVRVRGSVPSRNPLNAGQQPYLGEKETLTPVRLMSPRRCCEHTLRFSLFHKKRAWV